MMKIETIIRPARLERVKDALADTGVVGLNASQATGLRL